MITIVRMTRERESFAELETPYPYESIGGRYQQVWSLGQREAWLHGRIERLRILDLVY